MRKIIIQLVAILYLCLSVTADTFAQRSFVERYNMSYLDMMDGLPSNYIDDIYKDSYGFMWLATHGGGLVRYDGYSFVGYGIGSHGLQLKSNTCRNVCEDSFHRLWISFEECTDVLGLNTMRPVMPTCEKVNLRKILSQRSIHVYKDAKGKMWIVTLYHIYCLSFDANGDIANVHSFNNVTNTPDVAIKDIDGDGSVWVASGGTLFRLAVKNGRLVKSQVASGLKTLPVDYISDLLKYGNKVWIATNNGLWMYDLLTHRVKAFHHTMANHSISHNYVSSLSVTADNRLLVGTLCGVDILAVNGSMFEHWNTCSVTNPLSSNFVNCLLSVNGHIWVGTETDGIVKLVPRQLMLHNFVHQANVATSLSPNPVNAMYFQNNGLLWVGTVEGGLNCIAPGGHAFIHYTTANSNLSHNTVSTIAADSRGRLWIGTWAGGINLLDLKHPSTITQLEVPPTLCPLFRFVGAMAYDPYNDGMWIGSNDGVFFYDLKTGKIENPFPGNGEIRGCIGSIIDHNGQLWMGSMFGAIQVDLKSRKTGRGYFRYRHLKYKLDNPASGIFDKITCFCTSRDGSLWLGSNGYGLYHRVVDAKGRETFRAYTVENGLANNNVKGIVQDDKGMLWITTDHGLSQLNPQKGVFANYFEQDGLVSSQFYWNSAIKSPQGILCFGSSRGLITLLKGKSNPAFRGNLRFTRLAVGNQEVSAGTHYLTENIAIAKNIRVHESDKSFAIDFSALNYGNETQGVYSYRMKGFEDEWIQLPSGEHSVRYTSLPAGEYQFEVKYVPVLDSAVESHASILIKVSPYFWKSWWFVTLLFLLMLLVASYLYKRRLKVMKVREAEKLFRPIEAALHESEDPIMLQQRIQGILDNHKVYNRSQNKSVEADQKETAVSMTSFVDELMAVMEQYYGDPAFGVTELSLEMGMNKTALAKRIHEEMGQPTSQFMRNYRLNVARRMIIHNTINRNITEIAYRVGFNDPKYFTRCFTKLYGASPSTYKNDSGD